MTKTKKDPLSITGGIFDDVMVDEISELTATKYRMSKPMDPKDWGIGAGSATFPADYTKFPDDYTSPLTGSKLGGYRPNPWTGVPTEKENMETLRRLMEAMGTTDDASTSVLKKKEKELTAKMVLMQEENRALRVENAALKKQNAGLEEALVLVTKQPQ